MKLSTLAFLLLCLPGLLIGQVKEDSLWGVWQNQSVADELRVDALNALCSQAYVYSKPDSAVQLGQLAFNFAESRGLKKQMAAALNNVGLAASTLANYDQAIENYDRSLDLSKNLNDEKSILKTLNGLGNIYLKRSDYANAIDYYNRGFEMAEGVGNLKAMAALQNNIALVYMDLDYDEKSLEYLTAALEIYRELKNVNGEANALNNIGTIYRNQKDYEQALDYYQQSLALKEKLELRPGLATCYSNIGLIHSIQGDQEKALEYLGLSSNIHEETGNKKGIARNLIHFGKEYLPTKRDSAIALVTEGLTIARKTENTSEIADAAEFLYKAYQVDGEYGLALEMQKLYRDMEDQMFGARNQKALQKAEFAKREAELKKELEEKNRQAKRMRIIYFIGLALLIFGISFFMRARRAKNQGERTELLKRIELLKEKLAAQTVTSTKQKEFGLNKSKIESAINAKLGESSWLILNLLFEDPSISNKAIAEKVSLSVEGVSSSLRRMYSAFDIKSASNKKITLLMTAVRQSFEE